MRPQVFVAAGLSALLACATAAVADAPQGNRGRDQQQRDVMRFRGMDTNGDGVITRREWRGSEQSFLQHDWNGDGVLSGDEVRPGAQRQRRDGERFDARGFDDWTAEGFRSLDHNRDGRITANEWHFDRELFLRADRDRNSVLTRDEFLESGTIDLDLEDRFEYLDANNNGRVERGEWHGSLETFRWLDRNSDGVLSRLEVVGEEQPRALDIFTELDFNRDGRISEDEWHWSRRSFLSQDANRDGVISRAEFSAPAEAIGTIGTGGGNQVIVVDPTERWIDTGIELRPGDSFVVEVQGTIHLSQNGRDTATAAGANRNAANAPLPDQPAGALIARIGNATPMVVGADARTHRVAYGGRLYLGVNDDHLADNSGEFRVIVRLRR